MTDRPEHPPVPDPPDLPVPAERPLPQRVDRPGTSGWVQEAIATLPNLIKLLARLMKDRRVPLRRRALVAATAGYVLSPIDLVPDVIPVLGQVDDLLLAALALHHLVNGVEPEVVQEHWDGSHDVLELIQGILDWGANSVPWPVRRVVNRYVQRS